MREPLRLAVQGERPIYQGPLTLLAGPERLEACWWSLLSAAETEGEELALRDYYVAQSPHAGLLWVYRPGSYGDFAVMAQRREYPASVDTRRRIMNIEDQLEVAAAAREKLEALHREFMASVGSLKEPRVNGAEFRCVDGEMAANCLGVELRTKHRLIAQKGELELIEYTFMAQEGGDQLPICSIYLAANRRLYSDAAQENALCDMTNPYLASRVAPHLASKLLASKVFAPRA